VTSITVKFVGVLSRYVGGNDITLSLSGKADVLSLLLELEKTLLQKGSLLSCGSSQRAEVLVLVNGVEIGVLSGLRTELDNGDAVTLIPISHGG
jgi:molybdopterin converting factor small subunit